MIGMLRRKAERVILDTALKELRKRVEALHDDPQQGDTADPA
jgi:hypothetical protein